MFKKFINITLACSFLAVASCNSLEEPGLGVPEAKQDISAKIVHSKSAAKSYELVLVKFAGEVPELTDEALAKLYVRAYYPAFNLTGENGGPTTLEAKHGLDRWYAFVVDASANIGNVVESLASRQDVEHVEYNIQMSKASDCKVYPLSEGAASVSAGAGLGSGIFNDPNLPLQWHYVNNANKGIAETSRESADINVENVWAELTAGDPSIVVAVIDEGVFFDHPDLKANMWVNEAELNGVEGVDDDGNGYIDDIHGFNFVTGSQVSWGKEGDTGHGTHCAGTIAAVNNNGIGVSGVAGGNGPGTGVKIMSCQIFSEDRGGDALTSARAFKYAADNGATIASCSFGVTAGVIKSDAQYASHSGIEIDAIRYFEEYNNGNGVINGNVAIFAAGNESTNVCAYPGALADVISVSSIGPDALPTYYTNYGPGCTITAPGGEKGLPPYRDQSACVLSTLPAENSNGELYGYMQGTSMACPHVSGVAALALSYAKKINKSFTKDEFKKMIITSTSDFEHLLNGSKSYVPSSGVSSLDLSAFRQKMGSGLIDAWALMMQVEGLPTKIVEVGRDQWVSLDDFFGGSSENLAYAEPVCNQTDVEALGIEKLEIKDGKLWIHPTKPGYAKVKVLANVGPYDPSTETEIDGYFVEREICIHAKAQGVAGNGGWL